MEEAARMCVTEYRHLYLAFSRKKKKKKKTAELWVLQCAGAVRVSRVIFLKQHKVSMRKCRRCESAADLVHFSSCAIKATALATLRAASNCAEWKVRNQGLLRATSPLGHRHLWESTAVSAPWPKHASYACLTLACKTMLSVRTQTARAREYINQRPHTDLDGKLLLWLHIFFFYHAKSRYTRRTRGSLGVSDWSYESCNMILFDWMRQVQIGFPATPPPLPA